WIDRVPGGGSGKRRVIGIKGVNVMVRLPETFRSQGLEAFSRKGEPYYVFPWRDFHFIGPTETEVTANPDDIRVEDGEIDYILAEANHLFPDLHLTRADVLHCWCGVRPTSSRDGQTTSLPVEVAEDPAMPGLLAVTGSTIMLHRHAARKVARKVEKRLGKRGSEPTGAIPAPETHDDGIGQMAAREHGVRLSDLIRRRLPDGLEPDLGRGRAEELSRIAAASLGWSEARRQDELRHFEEDTARVYRQL
ncbi:FAD-dependent oxidoreductase, partial [Paracoccus sp. PXZ]